MKMAILTCYYNPCGYRLVREKYKRFRQALGNCDYLCVEATFNGRPETDAEVVIKADERHLLWQKERMLNIGFEHLRGRYDAVAWLDTDLLFLQSGWMNHAKRMLENHPVGQPYSKIQMTNAEGQLSYNFPSMCWKWHNEEFKGHACPGGAWAARLEAIPAGIMDTNVIGGGDSMQFGCWAGLSDLNWMMKLLTVGWRADWLACAARDYPLVQGNFGLLPGEIVHLYHGERTKRKYFERVAYLTEHAFDPTQHLRIDDNGLYTWTDTAPAEMVAKVAGYFAERDEDN